MTNQDYEEMQMIAASFYRQSENAPDQERREFYRKLAEYMWDGVSAIRRLSEAREMFRVGSNGNIEVEHQLWAMEWHQKLADVPFIEPTKYGFGKLWFVAGDNVIGAASLGDLRCVDCETIPKTTDKVYTFPVKINQRVIVCESCAEKRIGAYEVEHGEIHL